MKSGQGVIKGLSQRWVGGMLLIKTKTVLCFNELSSLIKSFNYCCIGHVQYGVPWANEMLVKGKG